MANPKEITTRTTPPVNPWTDLLKDVWDNKIIVFASVFIGLLLGVFVSMWTRPVYEANALIQVKTKGGSLSAMLGDVGTLLGVGGSSAETEVQLMQSRRILEEVIDSLGLDYIAKPVSFFDRLLHKEGRVDIRHLYFPDTSVIPPERRGNPWMLIADDSIHFSLYDDLENKVLSCEPGKFCSTPYQGDSVKILVSLMKAKANQKFEVSKRIMVRAVSSVSGNLSISEAGKKTGILKIAYQDIFPDRALLVIDSLTSVYLRLNEEFGTSDLKSSLELLETQLPAARHALDSLMIELNNYREKIGSADIAAETKITLESQVRLQQQIIQLEQMREEKARLFDESHPSIVTTDKQIAALKREMAKTYSQTKKLPETQQNILKMTEEVAFAKTLYSDLLKRVEQMRLLVAGSSESAKIIDQAVVDPKPVKPRKKLIVLMFLFFGFCASIALITLKKKIRGVEDPNTITKATGIGVYACIAEGKENAENGLRTLQLSLELKNFEKGHVICFSGLKPQDGNTFVASHLASLLAQSGKKVLFVDANMQEGESENIFHVKSSHGLVEVLAGQVSLLSAIQKTSQENLDTLLPGRQLISSEGVFGSQKFSNFIKLVRDAYDVVILDVAALLSSMDASVVSKTIDVFILTIKSGKHSMESLQEGVSLLPKGEYPHKAICINGYSSEKLKFKNGGRKYND